MPGNLFSFLNVGVGGTIEWVAVFLFVAFGVVYFLAPVVGYQSSGRGGLAASLYLLVGYGALTLLQLMITYLVYLAENDTRGSENGMVHLGFIFGILKLIVLLAAQVGFVYGLTKLRRAGAAT